MNDFFISQDKMWSENYVMATYFIQLSPRTDVVEKAKQIAMGQTLGTWVDVPGITEEMRYQYMGKIVDIIETPPFELCTQINDDIRSYLIQIAYPSVNFGPDFPMILTTLLGNDASTSAQMKLVDIQFPQDLITHFSGPKFGISGIRRLTGTSEDTPLLLNMIKPCTGISPEMGARIFYETALGGIDFIKDDELLSDPDFSRAADRVRVYNQAADAAYEKTGRRTIYVCNITSGIPKITDTLKAVVNAGVKAIMMCFSTVGYSTFQYISDSCDSLILGHYAGSGTNNEGILNGLSSHLSVGKFPRMSGADMVMMNTPYGGYPLTSLQYHKTMQQMTLPWYDLKPSMPICGGGVHPGLVPRFINDFGTNIILAAGGAIQGHPMGAASGVSAMQQAIYATTHHIPLADYAKNHEELLVSLQRFTHSE